MRVVEGQGFGRACGMEDIAAASLENTVLPDKDHTANK